MNLSQRTKVESVNIKSMLVRLQTAMGRSDLIDQMVLIPAKKASPNERARYNKSVNLVVGYNRSPSSQTALDVILWIAHQTRLATKSKVTVHIVYVVDDDQSNNCSDIFNFQKQASNTPARQHSLALQTASITETATPVLTRPRQAIDSHTRVTSVDPCCLRAMFYDRNHFHQADQILWQARCLADEWGGAFTAHLRFGNVGKELREVVEAEAAALMLLGCSSAKHPLIQKLGADFPCPVLGIPYNPDRE